MSPSSIVIQTRTTERTMQVGELIGQHASPTDIIALQGQLGAGKTQLVRGLAVGLGLNPRLVSSPTFVMVQEYEPADDDDRTPVLVHIDAYRISSPDELESIGWAGQGEELRDNAVVAIEWAKLIRPALGENLLWVEIEHTSTGRRLSISAEGTWQDKMPLLSKALREAGLFDEPSDASSETGAK